MSEPFINWEITDEYTDDEGYTTINVKIEQDNQIVGLESFKGYGHEARDQFAAWAEALDDVLYGPSFEERFAPFGPEWQREQEER